MSLEDAPAQKMFYNLGQRFFPNPLSNPAEGTLDSLPSITIDDAKNFWQSYGPQGAILSVAGKFDEAALMDHLNNHLAKWQGDPLPTLTHDVISRETEHIDQDTEQTQIGVAYDSVPLSDPGYYKARMGVMALSSGMSSRLFVEVREKRGLAYTVFASYISTKDFGGILGYAGTTTERAQETLDVLLAEMRRISEGITPDEFDKAKTKLKTNFIIQGESNRARAEAMVREYFHRDTVMSLDDALAKMDSLTLDEVNQYLATTIPEKFTILTLGKESLGVTV
jgi:predicted Zn-dependent peptidase